MTNGVRYADLLVDAQRQRLIAVCEDHRGSGESQNSLVAIDLNDQTGRQQTIASGADFYASPTLSPDGNRLAWLRWNHPNMPWDGTELWLADIQADGNITSKQCVAGGVDESVFQPQWGPDGKALLCFRSQWLVESVCLGWRSRSRVIADGSGIRTAAMGVWNVHLWL